MLTITEINKYADTLDIEYANEIKPLLLQARDSIENVFGIIKTSEFNSARLRCGFNILHFDNFPCDIQPILTAFGYFGRTYGDYGIESRTIDENLVTLLGYSPVCYSSGKLSNVFGCAEHYYGNNVNKIKKMTELKKKFNAIKTAFRLFFIENDGEMFKRFTGFVMANYNQVMNEDKKRDDEFRSLFGENEVKSEIKITITIEKI